MESRSRNLYLIPYGLWIVVFVVAPLILVFYYSMLDINGKWTLANYTRFFTPVYLKMAIKSFWYALLITAVSLVVAYPAALAISRTRHKQLWLLLTVLPSWINLLLKAYAFIALFSAHGPVNAMLAALGVGPRQIMFTDFSFLFVAVYIFVPFMILPIFNSIEEISPSLIAAAHDMGASEWVTLRRVIFPLTANGVKSGCRAVFIPALSLFMITRLIAGNRIITLGTAIEQHFLVTQDWGMGSTIAVFLVIAMGLIMALTDGTGSGHVGRERRV
jgi:spermidine/putrescine transport system permease protein